MTVIKFFFVCTLVLIKSCVDASDLTDALRFKDESTCILDAQCRTAHFCKTNFPNPVGQCTEGKGEGDFCIKDSVCASNACTFFKCKKRIVLKDGPCKHSADCPDDQFCDNVPQRSHIRQCFNRKCSGECRKDSECLSHKCRDSICANHESCSPNKV